MRARNSAFRPKLPNWFFNTGAASHHRASWRRKAANDAHAAEVTGQESGRADKASEDQRALRDDLRHGPGEHHAQHQKARRSHGEVDDQRLCKDLLTEPPPVANQTEA